MMEEEDDVPMVRVPAGEFIMGSTADKIVHWESVQCVGSHGGYTDYVRDEWPQMTVYLDEFEIDQVEVTYARYERCVEAGVCSPPREPAPSPEHPVLVEWANANTYCQWVGKRLPTEAEWEKAARGTDGRTYPWGDEWDPSRLQIHYTQGEGFETAPVGSYLEGASPYGVLDIAGNAPEWTNNPYRPYPGGQLMERIEGEHNLFVARGGYHGLLGTPDPPEILYRAADRFPRNDVSGFRCARGAAPSALEKAIVRSSVPTPPPTLESVSLAGMIEIPASEFEMGSDLLDLRDTSYHSPAHVVYLDTFYIDRYEATEAQYAAFLNALGQHLFACDGHDCILLEGESRMSFSNPSHIRKVGTQYVVDPGYEDYPVNRVYWYGAQAYCHWLGKRLPTEAEWEKAARGTDGRLYPWGNEWDVEKARYGAPLQPVGSDPFDVSPYGVIDMLGSVKEWVFDWYDPDYYTWSPTHNPWGPAEPGEHERKAARPGIGGAELVSRGKGTLDGFRCAYTP
jgi:formylglycine-generating enzyme required for sulfatase activity